MTKLNKAISVWATFPIFLLLALTRIPRLLSFQIDGDELWSIWQSIGTLDQVIRWIPYDWPPLHYVSVWAWSSLTGIHPFTERLLSLFIFMIGTACMFRAALRLTRSRRAAWLAALTYGAFGFTVYLSMLVRGYVLVYALTPLFLWLTVRYFDRPNLRRALPLGLVMVALFYTHLTTIFVFLIVGIYTLIVYGRQVWRWVIPGAIAAILAAPQIIGKLQIAATRLDSVGKLQLPPITEAIPTWYADFFGVGALVWMIVIGVLLVLALRNNQKKGLALLVWALFPIVMYLINSRVGFFSLRHLAWVGVGIALLIGFGVVRLPKFVPVALGALLVVAMFQPVSDKYLLYGSLPTLDNFRWLAANWRDGDAIYRDPASAPGAPEMWDYYARVYFPRGLRFTDRPDDRNLRRVWYASVDGRENPADKARVTAGRRAGMFVGPWNFLFRLYEAPPDPTGKLFENGLRFHGAEVIDSRTPGLIVAHENETIRLRVWWSAERPIDRDYSIVIQTINPKDSVLIAQTPDRAGSAETPKETSQWQPGALYVEEMTLTLPPNLYNAGDTVNKAFDVNLIVYQWWDGARVRIDGADFLRLDTLNAVAW
jgi:hypothetical protein